MQVKAMNKWYAFNFLIPNSPFYNYVLGCKAFEQE